MRIVLVIFVIIFVLAAAGGTLYVTGAHKEVAAHLPFDFSLAGFGQDGSPASGDSEAIMAMDKRIGDQDAAAAIDLQNAVDQLDATEEKAAE